MKVRSILAVVFLILLFALMEASTGCSESDSSSVKEMMKDIPGGVSSFAYCDLTAMRNDSDLEDLYTDIRNDYLTESGMYNIDFDDVNYLADCGGDGLNFEDLVVFRGKFDLSDIRNALEDNDYIATGYREEEVWLNSSEATMVALLKDTVAIGDEDDVEECIRVLKGEVDSLMDSEEARDVIDKLTGGIAVLYEDGGGFSTEEALGLSYKKKDSNTMSITIVFKFGDADQAEEVKHGIEELFTKTTDYEDINITSDGEFIILTGQLDIDDMVQ
ncbi:hypothetical protein ACFLTQ_00420 [Chloroflexota bacterium]